MRRSQTGVSLIESLLVVVIISVNVLLMANLPNARGLIQKSRHLSLAREIAAKALEDKRSISWANLVNDTTSVSDPRVTLLPQGTGEVLIEDCEQQICTNSENIKHLKVSVSWQENSKDQKITLDTFIGEGGLNQ